jgi:hypothetical protein
LLAARRCNEFRPLPSGYQQFLFVQRLVLYALAIEVGFKALALHSIGSAPRGRCRRARHARLDRARPQGARPTSPIAMLDVQDVFSAVRELISKEALAEAGELGITKRRKRRRKVQRTDAATGQMITEELQEDDDSPDAAPVEASATPASGPALPAGAVVAQKTS